MTDTSVRKAKRADELEHGDWVLDLASPTAASKVISAHPYNDGDDRVLVVYEDSDGRPATIHVFAKGMVPLASIAEIAKVSDDKRRYAVADQLRAVALLLDDKMLPLSSHTTLSRGVEFHQDDLATVEHVAELLGVDIEVDSAGRHSAFYRPAGMGSLVVGEWFTYVEKAAPVADATGLGYSRSDDAADDPTPVSPARVPLHTGAMTERGLVDETSTGGQ
jgi:hypothetical protein